jgi:hypothetical protein
LADFAHHLVGNTFFQLGESTDFMATLCANDDGVIIKMLLQSEAVLTANRAV